MGYNILATVTLDSTQSEVIFENLPTDGIALEVHLFSKNTNSGYVTSANVKINGISANYDTATIRAYNFARVSGSRDGSSYVVDSIAGTGAGTNRYGNAVLRFPNYSTSQTRKLYQHFAGANAWDTSNLYGGGIAKGGGSLPTTNPITSLSFGPNLVAGTIVSVYKIDNT